MVRSTGRLQTDSSRRTATLIAGGALALSALLPTLQSAHAGEWRIMGIESSPTVPIRQGYVSPTDVVQGTTTST